MGGQSWNQSEVSDIFFLVYGFHISRGTQRSVLNIIMFGSFMLTHAPISRVCNVPVNGNRPTPGACGLLLALAIAKKIKYLLRYASLRYPFIP